MRCGFPVRLTKEGRKSTPTLTNHKHPQALIIALIAEKLSPLVKSYHQLCDRGAPPCSLSGGACVRCSSIVAP